MSTIGDRVMARRIELGLTQLQLEELTGIRQATLSRLEQGVHSTSVHLPKLAIALQCTAEYLAFGNKETTSMAAEQHARLLYAAKTFKGWNNASKLAEMLTHNGYQVFRQGISNWKTRGLSYEAIVKCSQIIGCNPSWLQTGEGSPDGLSDVKAPVMRSEVEFIARELSDEKLQAWITIGWLLSGKKP